MWIHAVLPANVPVQLLPLARKYLQHVRHVLELGRVVLQIHTEDPELHPHLLSVMRSPWHDLAGPIQGVGEARGPGQEGNIPQSDRRLHSLIFIISKLPHVWDFHVLEISAVLGCLYCQNFCILEFLHALQDLHFGMSRFRVGSTFWTFIFWNSYILGVVMHFDTLRCASVLRNFYILDF